MFTIMTNVLVSKRINMHLDEFNPELFQEKYRIKSIRLPGWDYSADGYYFVTICVKNRECIFGDIKNGMMGLNELGCIAHRFFNDIPNHFNNVILDEFVIMPNHVHGIVAIQNKTESSSIVETRDLASLPNTNNQFGPLKKQSLQSIIHGFKSSVKRWANKNGCQYFQWQPRYHDHIIRNENTLNKICLYTHHNPQMWERDRNNPEGIWM